MHMVNRYIIICTCPLYYRRHTLHDSE